MIGQGSQACDENLKDILLPVWGFSVQLSGGMSGKMPLRLKHKSSCLDVLLLHYSRTVRTLQTSACTAHVVHRIETDVKLWGHSRKLTSRMWRAPPRCTEKGSKWCEVLLLVGKNMEKKKRSDFQRDRKSQLPEKVNTQLLYILKQTSLCTYLNMVICLNNIVWLFSNGTSPAF